MPRDQAWERHVEESLLLLGHADPPRGGSVVDIGSGTGAPGIAVAVLRPDLAVVLVEGDRRKAGFLVHVCGLLGLPGVEVAAVRAETLARDPGRRESFDVALSRAAAPPPLLCELALPLLRVGGRLVALIGAGETPGAAAAAARVCGGGDPGSPAPGVLEVVKVRPTAPAYPRSPGAASRRPLRER